MWLKERMTPANCPLTSACAPWHERIHVSVHTCVFVRAHTHTLIYFTLEIAKRFSLLEGE